MAVMDAVPVTTDEGQPQTQTQQPVPAGRGTVELQAVSMENVNKVRNLNAVLFPVRYSAMFYKCLVEAGQFAHLAFYGGTCVGTITCRKQPLGFADMPSAVVAAPSLQMRPPVDYEMYMMTLGVLAPYRRLGIARTLVDAAVASAGADPSIKRVVLHVQINNDDALRFYHKQGFTTMQMVERYYRLLEPPHAYLLQYTVR
ncbi:hypothetical protein GGF46_002528 [Coemansia sp. RSA 552]|nr:hypothetical protein GGF46_002528 [Coemansia sp. RSA 552]